MSYRKRDRLAENRYYVDVKGPSDYNWIVRSTHSKKKDAVDTAENLLKWYPTLQVRVIRVDKVFCPERVKDE